MRCALILAAMLVVGGCDGTSKDRLTDDQATAEAVGPEADNIDQNLAEEADAQNGPIDAASNELIDKPQVANAVTPAKDREPKLDPNGPSFECAGLLSRVEDMICSDPELAQRDRIAARNFARAMDEGTPDQQDRLRAMGRRYLADRDRCADTDCVMQAYRWYIRDIDGLMGWPSTL